MSTNFDRIAHPYRWLEYLTFGRALERCRTHFLPQVAGGTRAVVLGDGDGRFLAKLFLANPSIEATAVDTSATMLTLLHDKCRSASRGARLTLRHGNALDHSPKSDTDLIVAHFFFDCFTQSEVETLIGGLAQQIQPDALWLVSDFRIPPGAMRLPAWAIVRALYFIFHLLTGLRVTSLSDYITPLRASGLRRVDRRFFLGGMLTTELWRRPPVPPRL